MITIINTNKLNEEIDNKLKFDGSNSLANNPLKYQLQLVTIRLRGIKKSRQTLKWGISITCLWDSG